MEANWTFPAWRVFVDGASISAEISESEVPVQQHRPPFEAAADDFRAASRFWPVDDGWLVGFNHGEFGAALYWFSRDGKRHYEISRHHVVTFFALADGIHAIEGLAHGEVEGVQRLRPVERDEARGTEALGPNGRSHPATSKRPAAPMPPPMHMVQTTRRAPRRRPSMRAWPVRRLPVMP